ncbi:MAG: hypothetical protein PHH90_09785, partial [Limnochordia bacterium]|nr:hypothetical protein [Limnochordia bacterium]
VLNAGIARAGDYQLSLSSFALARSLVLLLTCYAFMVTQAIIALVKDADSFAKVRRFMGYITLLVSTVIALIAFTPLGLWVFSSIMGAAPQTAQLSKQAVQVLFLLPMIMTLRNIYQGLAIRERRTDLVFLGSTVQLLTATLLVFGLAYFTDISGAIIGAIAYVGSFGTDYLFLKRVKGKPMLLDTPLNEDRLSSETIGHFFLPLVATAFVGMVFPALINSALTRSLQPELLLPAFETGFNHGMLLVGPLYMLHQCSLNFTKPGAEKTYKTVRGFTLLVSGFSALSLAIVGFTPIGPWLFTHLVGLTAQMGELASGVIKVMAILPILAGCREYLWGIFMQTGRSLFIGLGKMINLAVTFFAVFTSILFWPIPSAAVALWILVIAEVIEYGFLHLVFRQCLAAREHHKAVHDS